MEVPNEFARTREYEPPQFHYDVLFQTEILKDN